MAKQTIKSTCKGMITIILMMRTPTVCVLGDLRMSNGCGKFSEKSAGKEPDG